MTSGSPIRVGQDTPLCCGITYETCKANPGSPLLPTAASKPLHNDDQCVHSSLVACEEERCRSDTTSDPDEAIQQALEFIALRDELCNPPRFQELGTTTFPPRPQVECLLQGISTNAIPYRTMWPRDCTVEVIEKAQATGAPIHKTLDMFVRIPKILLNATKPTKVKVWVDIHGGGGFTGSPTFVPWLFKALLQYQLQEENVVVVAPCYPFLLESNGDEILENNVHIWTWLFTKLQPTLRDLNKDLEVAWEDSNISCVSFGCTLAFDMVFLKLLKHPEKPLDFRIKKMLVRSCLTKPYARDEGEYMGVHVSREAAEVFSKQLVSLREGGRLMPRQSNLCPPLGMLPAYAFSVSRAKGAAWPDLWACDSVYGLVEQYGTCPNDGLRVDFVYGEKDLMVKREDVSEQVESLRRKFPDIDVRFRVRPGEGHAMDGDEDISYYAEFFASKRSRT